MNLGNCPQIPLPFAFPLSKARNVDNGEQHCDVFGIHHKLFEMTTNSFPLELSGPEEDEEEVVTSDSDNTSWWWRRRRRQQRVQYSPLDLPSSSSSVGAGRHQRLPTLRMLTISIFLAFIVVLISVYIGSNKTSDNNAVRGDDTSSMMQDLQHDGHESSSQPPPPPPPSSFLPIEPLSGGATSDTSESLSSSSSGDDGDEEEDKKKSSSSSSVDSQPRASGPIAILHLGKATK